MCIYKKGVVLATPFYRFLSVRRQAFFGDRHLHRVFFAVPDNIQYNNISHTNIQHQFNDVVLAGGLHLLPVY